MNDLLNTRVFRTYVDAIIAPRIVSLKQSILSTTGLMSAMLDKANSYSVASSNSANDSKNYANQSQGYSNDSLSHANDSQSYANQSNAAAGRSSQSASDSANSASASQSHANDSQNYANQSQNSAADARGILDTIKAYQRTMNKFWLGTLDSDPTKDGNGDPLQDGAEYFNKSTGHVRVWKSSDNQWHDQDEAVEQEMLNASNAAAQAAQSAQNADGFRQQAESFNQMAQAANNAAQNAWNDVKGAKWYMDTYWLGTLSSPPTTDRNGQPVQNGSWYYDSNLNKTQYKTANGWKTIIVQDDIDNLRNYTDGRFNDAWWKINNNATRLDNLDNYNHTVDDRINNLNNRFTGIDNSLASLQNDSGDLKNYKNWSNGRIDDLYNTCSNINNSINNATNDYNSKINNLRNDFNNTSGDLYNKITDINNRFGGNINDLYNKYNGLSGWVNGISNDLYNRYVRTDGSKWMTGPLTLDLRNNGYSDWTEGVCIIGNYRWGGNNEFESSPGVVVKIDDTPYKTFFTTVKEWASGYSYCRLRHVFDGGGKDWLFRNDGATFMPGDVYAPDFRGDTFYTANADVAENYKSVIDFPKGTIVSISISDNEDQELDLCIDRDRYFGVISTAPGVVINSELVDGVPVALAGRVPVRVHGLVKKGDKIYLSNKSGVGTANINDAVDPRPLGFALKNSQEQFESVVEVALKG